MITAKNLWLEFRSDHGLCGLCGNRGIIDTRGRAISAAGFHSGRLFFCICPNGRAWKKGGADLAKLYERMIHERDALDRKGVRRSAQAENQGGGA